MTRLNEENEAFVSSYHQEVEQLQAVAARLAEAREAGEAARARRAQLQQLAAQQAQELAQVEEGAAALCSREAADEARRAVEERLRGKRDMGEEEVASLLTPEVGGRPALWRVCTMICMLCMLCTLRGAVMRAVCALIHARRRRWPVALGQGHLAIA